MNAFDVMVDGKAVGSWDDLLEAIGADQQMIGSEKITGKLSIPTPGTYLQPGTTSALLWIESPAVVRGVLAANVPRIEIRITYCSIYEECWVRSSLATELEPKEVQMKRPKLNFGVSKKWLGEMSSVGQ